MLYLFSPAVRPHKPPEKSIFLSGKVKREWNYFIGRNMV